MDKAKTKYKIKRDELDGTVFDMQEYGVNPHSREIFLHGKVDLEFCEDAEPDIDYRTSSNFIKNISLLNQQGKGNILIHQITCGGAWEHGMAIYDAIIASRAPVTMLAYAHSRSMSSITIQAANVRVLTPNCMFMVHHGSLGGEDTVRGMISYIDQAKKDTEVMMKIYAQKCKRAKFFKKKTEKQIADYIEKQLEKKQEWFMGAEEAVYYGFADGVLGSKGFETIEKIRKRK